MKTIAELKKLNAKDFQKELIKARRDVMKLRFEAKTGQLSGSHKLHAAKKYIAQMLTVRQSKAETPKESEMNKDKEVEKKKVMKAEK